MKSLRCCQQKEIKVVKEENNRIKVRQDLKLLYSTNFVVGDAEQELNIEQRERDEEQLGGIMMEGEYKTDYIMPIEITIQFLSDLTMVICWNP